METDRIAVIAPGLAHTCPQSMACVYGRACILYYGCKGGAPGGNDADADKAAAGAVVAAAARYCGT